MSKEPFDPKYLELSKPEFQLNNSIGMQIKINTFSMINTSYKEDLDNIIDMKWVRKMNDYITGLSVREVFMLTSYLQKDWGVKYRSKSFKEIDDIIFNAPPVEKQMILYKSNKSVTAVLDVLDLLSNSKKITRIIVPPGTKCLMATNFANNLNNTCFIFPSTLKLSNSSEATNKSILQNTNSICPNLVKKIELSNTTAST